MRSGPLVACLSLLLCATATAQQHNVLLIIADDMGVNLVNAYHASPDVNHTPVIDSLASRGVMFTHAWSDPVCSSTRSTILTGRHGFRTGIGKAINYTIGTYEVPLSEVTLPEILAPGWRSAAIGKWHMAAKLLSGTLHPLLLGFEHHVGSMAVFPGVIGNGYYTYEKAVDADIVHSNVYATTDTVNDCLAQIQAFGSDPWFIWLAFNAPHAPFHKPPPNLTTFTLPANVEDNIPLCVKAMAEAMDTEMGRLFASMDPAVLANTVIIFVGDNGTDKNAITPPYDPDKAKGTVYEGGVHVPLIFSGPGVTPGAQCSALVSTTDLFATICDIAGVTHSSGTDSVSMLPYLSQPSLPSLRPWMYAEYYTDNGFVAKTQWLRAARDRRYKLISTFEASTQPTTALSFFDLQADPLETVNLLASTLTTEQQVAFAALSTDLTSLYSPWVKYGVGLPGTNGSPDLTGAGALAGGVAVTLRLQDALPLAPALLVIGVTSTNTPFKGGFLGPSADFLAPLLTGPEGSIAITAPWPTAMPANLSLFYQYWIRDAVGIKGFSSSNTAVSLTPM